MGKLEHFDIVYNNPQEVYNAGDVIIGEVRMTLREPMKMRCVKLEIFGKGKVHWSKTRRSGNSSNTTHYRSEEIYFNNILTLYGSGLSLQIFGKGKVHWIKGKDSDDPVHYRSEEIYINETIHLFGGPGSSSETSMHPTGAHKYAFNFQLPQDIPSSFEGEYGYVRYWCKAIIDKPWKFDHEAKNPFSVVKHVDLNRYSPQLREPVEDQGEEDASCCCCVSGTVSAKFKINKTAFVPGETIFVSGSIKNDSNATVSEVGAKLVQRINFYGVSDSLFTSGEAKPKEVKREVARFSKGSIEQNQTFEFDNERLVIPPIPPSELPNCQCIDIKYEVTCFAEPEYSSPIKIKTDVFIGTIPHQPVVTYQPPAYADMAPTAPPAPPKDGLEPMAGFAPTGSGFAPPGTGFAPPGTGFAPPGTGFAPPGAGFAPPGPPGAAGASAPALLPPPPSYESCVFGSVAVKDDGDSSHVRGRLDYAPLYTYYNWNQAPGGAPMPSAPPASAPPPAT